MPLGKTREKVFYGLAAARGRVHRYTWIRWGVGVAFTALVAALPFADVLRFDLWSGRHVYLGEQQELVAVARRFAFPFLAVNLLILVVTRLCGRYLCGFVCPYGSLARLAEWVQVRGRRSRGARVAGLAALLSISLALAAIVLAFWVDPEVFRSGSRTAVAASGAFLLGTAAVLFASTWRIGLRFCRDWCPSGVYFAVLGPDAGCRVRLRAPEDCIDCDACDRSCPIDLAPRAVDGVPEGPRAGFYPDGFHAAALCIRCGDCVAACEQVTARSQRPAPLALGCTLPTGRTLARAAAPEHADLGERPDAR